MPQSASRKARFCYANFLMFKVASEEAINHMPRAASMQSRRFNYGRMLREQERGSTPLVALTEGSMRLVLLVMISLVTQPVLAQSLLLTNARVYTVNDQRPQAEAVVVADGRITYVGSNAEALKRAPHDARRIDLTGRTVVPGLTDAHAHLAGIGQRELSFNLEGARSLQELQARLRERAAEEPGQGWIVGRGWIESQWTPAQFPTRHDLDAVVANRPVYLVRADGHAAVANTRALELAGIDGATADPIGGQIIQDPESSQPTGMLIDHAMDLVNKLIPPPTVAELRKALQVGAERSVRLGWTQLQIAGQGVNEIEQLCALYQAGQIKLRVYSAVSGPGADAERLLAQDDPLTRCSQRLVVKGIKLYIDGALGSRGAALLQPYSDAAESKGLTLNTPEQLMVLLTTALRRGIQIQTHAIGDRGNRLVLDMYDEAYRRVPVGERAVVEPRWRIEHAQVLHRDDIPRFARIGVIASMQPSHAISDLFFAPARLGSERLSGAYAWRNLLDAGAIVAGGSDAPVEQGDPMIEFYAAVARKSLDGFADERWHREQRVTRLEALKMFTLWPAYAAFQERERGSIEEGKLADLTVLSADILQIPESDILKTRAVMTIIGGEVVHSAL
jgi:predicted amidohydrolase YtcJ